jgi:hypothetical protein
MENYTETIATGFVKPKTTSLFYDKIWLPESLIRSHLGEGLGYSSIPVLIRPRKGYIFRWIWAHYWCMIE